MAVMFSAEELGLWPSTVEDTWQGLALPTPAALQGLVVESGVAVLLVLGPALDLVTALDFEATLPWASLPGGFLS